MSTHDKNTSQGRAYIDPALIQSGQAEHLVGKLPPNFQVENSHDQREQQQAAQKINEINRQYQNTEFQTLEEVAEEAAKLSNTTLLNTKFDESNPRVIRPQYDVETQPTRQPVMPGVTAPLNSPPNKYQEENVQPVNPLSKYTRIAGISTALPSRGYYNAGEIIFDGNDEITVYPMTIEDEINLKNPDSLLNGSAIVNLLKSCVPNVVNPRRLPVQDVDVLLLAINASSVGNTITNETVCPKCNNEIKFNVNIREHLETMTFLEKNYSVTLSTGLVVHMRPIVLDDQTKLQNITFNQTKKMRYIQDSETLSDEDKAKEMTNVILSLSDASLRILANSIIKISTPEGDVSETEFIYEFLKTCSSGDNRIIQELAKSIGEKGINKTKRLKCTNVVTEEYLDKKTKDVKTKEYVCNHEFDVDITFDPSNFFD